ncbi:hypothetical protein PG995_004588 [Apiospora arundinis]
MSGRSHESWAAPLGSVLLDDTGPSRLVEYSCGHFRFRVQRWCSHYERTHRVCPPNITTGELRGDELCTDCRPDKEPLWMDKIRQSVGARQHV